MRFASARLTGSIARGCATTIKPPLHTAYSGQSRKVTYRCALTIGAGGTYAGRFAAGEYEEVEDVVIGAPEALLRRLLLFISMLTEYEEIASEV